MTQVLQQAPNLNNRQQAEQLAITLPAMKQTAAVIRKAGTAGATQVLSAVLRQQAAFNAGTLVVWAQQRPEQLWGRKCTEQQAQGSGHTRLALSIIACIWMDGVFLLEEILSKAFTLDSSSATASRIVTSITEQLERSGEGRWLCIHHGMLYGRMIPNTRMACTALPVLITAGIAGEPCMAANW
jgi:hypothetical protein